MPRDAKRSSAVAGLISAEPLLPSEDFLNLIAEGMAPERYGRAAELDSVDRMMWSELTRLDRRMRFLALARRLPLLALAVCAVALAIIHAL